MSALLRLVRRARRRVPLGARLRAITAVLAFAAVLAPSAASVADGVLAAGAGRGPAVAHVEDARRPDCPFVHAADCVRCDCASLLALPAPLPRLAEIRREPQPTPAARQEFWRAVAVAAAPARAPPMG